MNTRMAAPVLGTVSLVALLVGGTGAAQARVMIDDGPRAAASQGVSNERTEAIRFAKQVEARTTTGVSPSEAQGARLQKFAEAQAAAGQGVSFERIEAIRSAKQVEARTSTGISPADAQGARLQKLAEQQADADERLQQQAHGASSERLR